jgi:hypothetical protein
VATTLTAALRNSAPARPLISLAPADREALQLVEFGGVTQVEAASSLARCRDEEPQPGARLHLRTALDECCRIALDYRGGVIATKFAPIVRHQDL